MLFVLASAAEKAAVPTRGLVLACIVADERSYRSCALFVLASAAETTAVPTRGLLSLIRRPSRVIVHDAVTFCLVCRGGVTRLPGTKGPTTRSGRSRQPPYHFLP